MFEYNKSLKKRGSLSLFTTVAARAKLLGKHFKRLSKVNPTDLVLNCSGFKIYGEGEWTVRQHGKQKRTKWKKFHFGICPKMHEVVVAEVTELEVEDSEIGPKLLKKAPRSVKNALGNGGYDTWNCYKAADCRGPKLIVPSREVPDLIRETNPG